MKFRFQFLSGARAGEEVVVPAPMARLGRDPGNEVPCDAARDDRVSTYHAQLLLTDAGVLLLSDLASSNGTFVEGRRLEAPLPISSGTIVALGGWEDGVRVAITLLNPNDPNAAKATLLARPTGSGKPWGRLLGALLALLILLGVGVGLALREGGAPNASPSPGPSLQGISATPPVSPEVNGAQPPASPGASVEPSPPGGSPRPEATHSPNTSRSPLPPGSKQLAPQRSAWQDFGVGTRFVIQVESEITLGGETTRTLQTHSHQLKALEDHYALVELRIEGPQFTAPLVSERKVPFAGSGELSPTPLEEREVEVVVPAGTFSATYRRSEREHQGKPVKTETWTSPKLPVAFKVVTEAITASIDGSSATRESQGARVVTTSVLVARDER